MSATPQLHDLGQSLWLDNTTRGILNDTERAMLAQPDHTTAGRP
jgi:hypothetical protein